MTPEVSPGYPALRIQKGPALRFPLYPHLTTFKRSVNFSSCEKKTQKLFFLKNKQFIKSKIAPKTSGMIYKDTLALVRRVCRQRVKCRLSEEGKSRASWDEIPSAPRFARRSARSLWSVQLECGRGNQELALDGTNPIRGDDC